MEAFSGCWKTLGWVFVVVAVLNSLTYVLAWLEAKAATTASETDDKWVKWAKAVVSMSLKVLEFMLAKGGRK